MRDNVIYRQTFGCTIRNAPTEYEWTNGLHLYVTAELHQLGGNERPHFSVTGEVWDSAGWRLNGQDGRLRMGGCIHELILSQFPKLAPVVALHLADDTGEPMHAAANGWYWYADYDGKGTHLYPHNEPMYSMTPHQRAAHHLRIPEDDLPAGMSKDAFYSFVEELKDRWAAQRDEAIEILKPKQAGE